MRINSISLSNIRSYSSLTIDFPDGRTLLSGDIGTGKSTILIALEFALFGLVKGWNDGERLLRNGKSLGTVTVDIQIADKRIIITRQLKRKNGSVQQGDVIISNSGNEKKITPTEARATILELMGYPLEYQSRQPLSYRFTIFTPQENMKQVMSENNDTRIGIIRKLFSVDRYSRIIENSQLVAKWLRENAAEYKGQLREKPRIIEEINRHKIEIESLREEERRKKQIMDSEEEKLIALTREYESIIKKEAEFESSQKSLDGLKKEVMRIKDETKRYEQYLSEMRTSKESQLQKLSLIINNGDETQNNPAVPDKDYAESMIISVKDTIAEKKVALRELESKKQDAEKKLSTFTEENNTLNLHRQRLEQNIENSRSQINDEEKRKDSLNEKIIQITGTDNNEKYDEVELSKKIEVLRTIITSLHEKIAVLNSENNVMQKELEDIDSMEYCRVCRQKVDNAHKKRIREEYETKNINNSEEIQKLKEQLKKSNAELEILNQNLEKSREKQKNEALLRSFKEEISGIDEKIRGRREIIEKITANVESCRLKIIELNSNLEQSKDNISALNSRYRALQAELESLRQKEQLLNLLLSSLEKINNYESLLEKNDELHKVKENEITILEGQLNDYNEKRKSYEYTKSEYEKTRKSSRDARDSYSKAAEKISSSSALLKRSLSDLERIREAEEKKTEIESAESFISKDIPSLARSIENAVMQRILVELNGYFQKWFSMMISDIEAYLDNEFSPVIIQDGYELSYDNLSGGERTSLALAYRLALNETLHDMMATMTTGLLILDEPTEGFSTEQLDTVRQVLDEINVEQLIIVSHEEKMESFVDNIIRVEKIGGVSGIN